MSTSDEGTAAITTRQATPNQQVPRAQCSLCHRSFKDILLHLRQGYKGHHFSSSDVSPYGLLACSCGVPVRSTIGLSQHQAKLTCRSTYPPSPPRRSDRPVVIDDNTFSSAHPLPPTSSPTERFLKLAQIPTIFVPLPGRLVPSFISAAERCAVAFLDCPSEQTLLDFLALPKVGVLPSALHGASATSRLQAYPDIEWPEGRLGLAPSEGLQGVPKVEKLVEKGRLGSAGRVLTGTTRIAEVNEETLSSLRGLHPEGPQEPFGPHQGPQHGEAPDEGDVQKALASLKWDTAPGISGWTVPLLRIAARNGAVLRFLTSLTGMITSSSAPGRAMLCASRITPLLKASGGIRPIAVGCLIYRLAAKTIQRKAFKSDFLLKTQFGVGTKGGVEPIIRAVERGLEGTLDRPYTILTSLDFSNAFNTCDRLDIEAGLRLHAPTLFRTGKWAYGGPSVLVLPPCADGPSPLLCSSQGVRQGDPLCPLFFSLAIRPLLSELQAFLGPDRVVFAYLDDIYILSASTDPLPQVHEFFVDKNASIRLNASKCMSMDFAEIREKGLKILGSCVGPKAMREDFLREKVEEEESNLDRLRDLPSQHALLLLRSCFQQDLRHLQRSLLSSDLGHLWNQLDTALYNTN